MEKVYEGKAYCPVCGKNTLNVTLYKYRLPAEGPVILFVGRCENCGSRVVDVIPLELGREVELTYDIDENTLRKIIFLPGDTEISIPELGAELILTPAFKGRITTIEGILRMIQENSPEELKKKIDEVIEGKRKAKLTIRNKSGLLKEIKI